MKFRGISSQTATDQNLTVTVVKIKREVHQSALNAASRNGWTFFWIYLISDEILINLFVPFFHLSQPYFQ